MRRMMTSPSVETLVELSQGVHVLTFVIDLRKRGEEGLRVFVEDVPGSPARARVVDGL